MWCAYKRMATTLFIVFAATVARSFSADRPDPQRLPTQKHNRMLSVMTEGKDDVFVNMPGHFDVGSPSLSPDGKWIAFDALTIGERPVRESWLVGADGNGLRKIADGAAPRWSPDAGRVLITRQTVADGAAAPQPQSDIVERELADGREHRVCEGRFGDRSPDGKRIAFARGSPRIPKGGTRAASKIYIANADGTGPWDLGDGDWPSWAPDSKTVACCLYEALRAPTLWIIDVESKNRKKLGSGFYRAQWAGDGKSVVCNVLSLDDDGVPYRRDPGRFWLHQPLKPVIFHTDLDNPWSPCVSRDGKTMVLVVDSESRAGPSVAGKEESK
jgi:Tol biopolymer transport system component